MNIEDLKYKLENDNYLLSMHILCKYESVINDRIVYPCTLNCKMYWVDKINGCIIGRYESIK